MRLYLFEKSSAFLMISLLMINLLMVSLLTGCKGFSESAGNGNYTEEFNLTEESQNIDEMLTLKSELPYTETSKEFTISLTEDEMADLDRAVYTILYLSNEERNEYVPVLRDCEIEAESDNTIKISKEQKVCTIYSEEDNSEIIVPDITQSIESGKIVWSPSALFLYSGINTSYDFLAMDVEIMLDSYSYANAQLRNSSHCHPQMEEILYETWHYMGLRAQSYMPSYDVENNIQPLNQWIPGTTEIHSYRFENLKNIRFSQTSIEQFPEAFYGQLTLTYKDGTTSSTGLMQLKEKDVQTKRIETENGCLDFEIYEEEAVLVSYQGTDTHLEIPKQVEGCFVTQIAEAAFNRENLLEELIFPSTMKKIGERALSGCTNLTRICLNEGLTQMESYAFSGCSMLTCIEIPASVSYIGQGAFWSCSSLKEIRVNENNRHYKIENHALFTFDGKSLLAVPNGVTDSFIIPPGVEEVCEYAFADDSVLKEVQFPDTLKRIGAYAFSGVKLQNLVLPESLEFIGNHAFSNGVLAHYSKTGDVIEIPTIQIGKNVKWIADNAFAGYCIYRYEVDPENAYYCSEDGLLLSKDKTYLSHCPTGRSGTLEIPEGIVNISENAFLSNGTFSEVMPENRGIENLILSDTVQSISCLRLPVNLKYLKIGSQVNEWNDYSYCRDLELEVSKDNPNYIWENGILYNADKTELYLHVGDGSSTEYTIPDTISYIESDAFSQNVLTDITFPKEVKLDRMTQKEVIDCFAGLSGLLNIHVEEGNTNYSSSDGVLMDAKKKVLLIYPDGKEETEYVIPEGIETVSYYAFYFNDTLTKLFLPSTLKDLRMPSEYADFLYAVDDLKTIEISKENPYYEMAGPLLISKQNQTILYLCNGEECVVQIPDGMKKIGDGVFKKSSMDAVDEVHFPEGITDIGTNNFVYIRAADQWDDIQIYLPDSLERIEGNSFLNSPGIVLHVWADSYGETFAKENNINYEIRK